MNVELATKALDEARAGVVALRNEITPEEYALINAGDIQTVDLAGKQMKLELAITNVIKAELALQHAE